jgi:hypothetical protein
MNDEAGKRAGWRKITGIGCGVVALILAGLIIYVGVVWEYKIEDPRTVKLRNPKGTATAVLMRHGALMASRMSLYVRSHEYDTTVWVGTVDADDTLTFGELCWSSDGTVLAARCRLTGYSVKDFPKNADLLMFTHAYDLKEDRRLAPGPDVSDGSPQVWTDRAKRIEDLLQSRGVIGVKLAREDREYAFQRISRSEWKPLSELEE